MMWCLLLIAYTNAESYMHIFAQEWPGSICLVENCTKEYLVNLEARRWNIHGLWPNLIQSTYCQQISECRVSPYDPEAFTPETQKLVDSTWVGLYSDTDYFRKHEWEKHGTCFVHAVNQNSYFQIVGGLSLNYDFWDILANSWIYPHNTRQLTDYQIREAFSLVIQEPHDVHYSCVKVDGKFYLGQMKICFNDALKPRPCSCKQPLSSVGTLVSCGPYFYYPEFIIKNEQ